MEFSSEERTRLNAEMLVVHYYISRYETTVEQWELFLNETSMPYQWKDEYTDMRNESPYPDSPIGVHWKQAVMYANWVSRKYGLEECYIVENNSVEWNRSSNGYRLLTDAEWEYAARGGAHSEDYDYAGSNNLDEVAWTWWNSDGYAHKVGLKKANELGLFDMSGNSDEWCWDLSLNYSYAPSQLLVNPTGPSIKEYLKVKGEQYRIAMGGHTGGSEEKLFLTFYRSGLYEFGIGAGGPGIRLARNVTD